MAIWEKLTNLIGGGLKDLVAPVGAIIDNIHTSDEEKLILKNEITKLQAQIESQLAQAEMEVQKSYHQVMIAEQQSGNWLAASWRPILGIGFMVLLFIIYGIPAVKGTEVVIALPEMFWVSFLGLLGVQIHNRSKERIARIDAGRR